MIPLSKTKLRKKKRNNNSNQDDDDDNDDGGIEHRRHDIVFLDKKQEWCHIIVIVVPGVGVKARKRLSQTVTKRVKSEKRKVGKAQGFKKEGCSAEECKCFRIT